MDPRREYAATFLGESLGLVRGAPNPDTIPGDFVDSLAQAMAGGEEAATEEPQLEKKVLSVGAELVRAQLDTEGFVIEKERWPGAARYAACLTHDVDNVSRPFSHTLKHRERFTALDLVLAAARLKNLYDNTSDLARLEGERKLHSSFYFLSGHYDLRQRVRQLNSIRKLGWEIGLHGDFGTHDSETRMSEAISRFEESTGIHPAGVREHYLRFDFASTWRIMDRAGFAYDSTVGNTDKLGFRLGLCNPFRPPDSDWKPLGILELPLALMDVTLWGYLKRTESEGVSDFERLKESVKKVGGLLTILWHPEGLRMRGGRIYAGLLDSLLKDGCFIGSGIELADWWLKRAAPLTGDGKIFRMDDASAGLVLRFKAKGGESADAEGGTVGEEGGSTVIRARGGPLKVTVR